MSNKITYAKTTDLDNKVDKDGDKILSDNNYTTEEKEKLAGLENYDDTELKEQINSIIPQFVFGSETAAVEYFIEHPDTKAGIIVSIMSGTLLNYRFNLYSFGGVITTQPDGNTGVLLNEITPTQMENKNNKVTSIDDNDSEKKYPSVKAVVDYVATKADKTKVVTFENNAVITLQNNTEYVGVGDIRSFSVAYPEGDFLASINFTINDTLSEGITITLPESKYIGEVPTFSNNETWELNIKNGVVVGGKIG